MINSNGNCAVQEFCFILGRKSLVFAYPDRFSVFRQQGHLTVSLTMEVQWLEAAVQGHVTLIVVYSMLINRLRRISRQTEVR